LEKSDIGFENEKKVPLPHKTMHVALRVVPNTGTMGPDVSLLGTKDIDWL
jgi:hypothetical protein